MTGQNKSVWPPSGPCAKPCYALIFQGDLGVFPCDKTPAYAVFINRETKKELGLLSPSSVGGESVKNPFAAKNAS